MALPSEEPCGRSFRVVSCTWAAAGRRHARDVLRRIGAPAAMPACRDTDTSRADTAEQPLRLLGGGLRGLFSLDSKVLETSLQNVCLFFGGKKKSMLL